jgi:hypothetical protein
MPVSIHTNVDLACIGLMDCCPGAIALVAVPCVCVCERIHILMHLLDDALTVGVDLIAILKAKRCVAHVVNLRNSVCACV